MRHPWKMSLMCLQVKIKDVSLQTQNRTCSFVMCARLSLYFKPFIINKLCI